MSTVFTWHPRDIEALLASCEGDEVTPLIREHFPASGSVLECGCGLGRFVRYLTDRGYRAFGVERSLETLKPVHAAWPDLPIVDADAAVCPFPRSSFDALLSLGLIEHWTEGPAAILQEHYRVLKPGGVAIITVPLHSTVRQWKRRLWFDEISGLPRGVGRLLLRGGSLRPNRLDPAPYAVHPAYGPFFEYRLTRDEFSRAVAQAGFEILAHQPLAHMDGVYHELNPLGLLVGFRDWRFRPTPVARTLDSWLSRRPFVHGHMQAIVARRPPSVDHTQTLSINASRS
jgi:SAM-dependent methyltransferase